MTSAVDICNLALARLGDEATVVSIDPPEGSAQAEHCAIFYPIARDALQEMHDWGFNTLRVTLAQVSNSWSSWAYAYERPSDAVRILSIIPSDAPNDWSFSFPMSDEVFGTPMINQRGVYIPQPFAEESQSDGTRIIFTNQENAVARYTRIVTDTAKFTPLFNDALGWYLASYLAGPILKADTGISIGRAMAANAMQILSQAKLSAAAQQRQDIAQQVPWLVGR